MQSPAADLAIRLGRQAEAVCRHYLSAGKRAGNYWLVGDVQNTPGRSLYVRLTGPERGAGAAGRWADGATGVEAHQGERVFMEERDMVVVEWSARLRLTKAAVRVGADVL